MSVVGNIKSMSTGVAEINKEVEKLFTNLEKVKGVAAGALSAAKGVVTSGGSLGLGQAVNRPGTGADNARFATDTQPKSGNYLLGSLAGFSLIGGLAKAGLGVAAGAYAAMPDASATMSRATGYYQAALYGGVGYSRSSLERATLRALGGGLSSPGSDAAVAAILTRGIGMAPGSFSYLQTVQQVGGAAKYLGMSNATAASAIGGMYTGPMGANLYQYGINTIDKKGNAIPMSSIAQQLYKRIFVNGATKSQVQSSLQYGFAGANLQALGFDQAQQDIYKQMFLDISQGKNPNLALKDTSSAGGTNLNPLSAMQTISSSQTQLMQASEQGVIRGFTDAAHWVEVANKKLEVFGDSLGRLSGFINGMGGSNVGRGIAVGGGIVGNALGMLGAGALLRGGTGALKGMASGGVRAVGGALASVGTGLVAGKGASALARSAGLSSGYRKGAGALSGAAAGALTGAVFAPETLGLSVLAGGLIGGLSGFFGSGGGGQGYGGNFGPKGGGSTEAMSPIPGIAATAQYGQTDDSNLWNWKGYHTGQDYPVPVGTSVRATRDGVVSGEPLGKDYGTAIVLNHADGYQTIYGHLSSKLVRVGQNVTQGQVIGKSGQSGNVTGPHLHYEVRQGKNNPVNPNQLAGSSGSTGGSNDLSGILGSQSLSSLYAGGSVAPPISPNGGMFTAGGVSGGVSKTVVGGGSQQSFAKSLLKALGAPITKTNVGDITTWMAYEGGNWKNNASFNPLNTTLNLPGAQSVNSHGVKAYGDWSQGIAATIGTLTGRASGPRGYDAIVSALKAGNVPTSDFTKIVGKSSWGTFKGGGGQGYGAHISGATVATGSRTVNVTLKIDKTSEQEAVLFVKRIKSLLEEDADIAMIGA